MNEIDIDDLKIILKDMIDISSTLNEKIHQLSDQIADVRFRVGVLEVKNALAEVVPPAKV